VFTSPVWLLLLGAVAALAIGYVLLLRRRRRDTVAFTNLELLDRVAPRRPGPLRHLPAVALITSLAVLAVALAGPQAEARVPRNRATVVLVIDVSLSMQATDVAPTRLVAAQVAAKDFADQLTPGVNLGLVAFAGTAAVLVSPTVDRDPVKRAVDGLRLSESTATGEAIFAAMQSVETFALSLQGTSDEGAPPARIVLLSDGKQTIPTPAPAPRRRSRAARSPRRAPPPRPTSRCPRSRSAPASARSRSRASAPGWRWTTRRCAPSPSSPAGSSSPPPARRTCARSTPSWASRSATRRGGST
jgi:Ca-activated chloride channel family protein